MSSGKGSVSSRANQQTRLPADQQTRLPADQQTRLPADQQTRLPADQQTRLPADQQTRLPADQQTRLPADRQTRLTADQQPDSTTSQQSESTDIQPPESAPDFKILDSPITEELPSTDVPSMLYKFDKEDHVSVLIDNIRLYWQNNQMIDVQIVASDKTLHGFHMILLAGYSSIFQKIFCNTNMNWFQGILAPNDDIDAEWLSKLQDCLYKPSKFFEKIMKEQHHNKQALTDFATFFGLEDLAISAFLDRKRVLSNWESLFHQKSLTFSILQCNDTPIPCHGPVLVSSSPIFRDQFTEDEHDPLSLLNNTFNHEGCPENIMKKLLSFVYSAEIQIDTDSVEDLLTASCELRMLSVAKACCTFILRILTPENSIKYLFVAKAAYEVQNDEFCRELFKQVEQYIIGNFGLVMETEDFKRRLSEENIIQYMAQADLTHVEGVKMIEALLQWHAVDTVERTSALARLLALVTVLKDREGLSATLTFAGNQDQPRLDFLGQVVGILQDGRQ